MSQPADSSHLLLLPESDEALDRPARALDALLSGQMPATEIPALEAAAGGLPYFTMLRELFRLGEADFVVRMAVLSDIAESDRPRWEPDSLVRHFGWLATEALGVVLRGLRRSGWLELEGREHRLTDRGEAVYPLLRRLTDVRPMQGDLALGVLSVQLSRELGAEAAPALRHLRHNLCRIADEAEVALSSHSEVRILEARQRIDRNLAWARRARVAIEDIDLAETEAYRVAQAVGQQLSELHRWHAALQRALGDLADKRVALGDSGLSIVDLTQFLMRCDVDMLADFGESLVAVPVAPTFALCDNLVLEAEAELVHGASRAPDMARYGWAEGAPEIAGRGEPELPEFTALERFIGDLAALQLGDGKRSLAELVPTRSWAESAYRLSLLALAETPPPTGAKTAGDGAGEGDASAGQGGDPALSALSRSVPFWQEIAAPGREGVDVDDPFDGAISRGFVVRLDVATGLIAGGRRPTAFSGPT